MSTPCIDRRMFIGLLSPALLSIRPQRWHAGGLSTEPIARALVVHPDPRPGITGAKVLTAAQLTDVPDLIPIFDGIRQYASMADGIRCSCGCAVLPGHRSLLSCFEPPAMAASCEICQGQAKLVARRAEEGQTLAQIRQAIDARFNAGPDHDDRMEHQR